VINEIKPDVTFVAPVRAAMAAEYNEYAGYYGFSTGIRKVDISEDGILSISSGEDTSPFNVQRFIYTGDGKFYNATGNIYVSFVKETNGNTYLYLSGYASYKGLGQIATSSYQAQKLSANPLSGKVKAAWEKRNNKNYFRITEKYSSELYLSAPFTTVTLLKGLEGYAQSASIKDESTAQILLKIPQMNGRDLNDFTFFIKNKKEYAATTTEGIFISEDAIKTMSSKSSFKVKIGSDGYAVWYKLGSKSTGKKIKVTLPEKSSYSVYDKNGILVFNSVISDKNQKVKLPKAGYLVFVGNADASFTVNYVK
jgi:hypothetical protein